MTKITDNLYIGDIQDARERPTDYVDRVITVCQDEVSDNVGCEYEWYNMADGAADGYGGDSSYSLFEKAAEALVEALENDEEVLIHCHMGRSRSTSVSAAALGVINGITYEEARDIIMEKRYMQPDRTLVDHSRRFIRHNS